MKIFISLSSRTNINEEYIKDADYISDALAHLNYDLIVGVAMNKGMPGVVLQNFNKNGRNIDLITMKKYKEDPNEFSYVNFSYVENTFDRTKEIYFRSDALLLMPGGTGTMSELFSLLEQIRTDESGKKIIIYNKNNHYENLINQIKKCIEERFNDDSIYDYLIISKDKDELVEQFQTLIERHVKTKK